MMELVYLWVEDYKNIHEQGFNFSPRFTCDYDEEKNELTIDENDEYIENFFGDNINVTAIVGKNGSGKSSILNIISNNLTHVFNENSKGISFQLYYDDNHFYVKLDGKVTSLQNQNSFLTLIDINKKKSILKEKILETKKIFLDRVCYNKDLIIEYDSNKFMDNKKSDSENFKLIINLLKSEKVKINFQLPTHIIIKIEQSLIRNFLRTLGNFDTKIDINIFRTIDSLSVTNQIDYKLILLYITKKQDYLKNFSEIQELSEQSTSMLKQGIPKKDQEIIEWFRKIGFHKDELKLEINNLSRDFIENCEIFSENYLIFDFYPYPSHGEYSFLLLFARLYNELNNIKDKNVIELYIDEGELSFHPKWQKEYLNRIIKFLKTNFKDLKFHIILTSHSPFLLSDIPKQNIIFLDKEENGNCKVLTHDEVLNKKQTFGANIHTLLSDSFFMEDGLMGEFAKGKINEIIDFHKLVEKKRHYGCLKKIYVHSKKQKFEDIQKIIGEDYLKQVIKNHLVEIEKSLLGVDKSKKEEIKRVEAYLESLRK